jgi:ribonuclease HI
VGPDELEADFDSSLGMEPINLVYTPTWNPPLPVTTVILPQDEALQALDLALRDERRRASTWFTDGSLMEGWAGGAAVWVEGAREMERVIVPLGNGQVCEGEMEGLVQATMRALQDGHPHVLCVADSQAALRDILSTKRRSGQFRAIAYDRIICDALHSLPHLTILNLWTSAHIGTNGDSLLGDGSVGVSGADLDSSSDPCSSSASSSVKVSSVSSDSSESDSNPVFHELNPSLGPGRYSASRNSSDKVLRGPLAVFCPGIPGGFLTRVLRRKPFDSSCK